MAATGESVLLESWASGLLELFFTKLRKVFATGGTTETRKRGPKKRVLQCARSIRNALDRGRRRQENRLFNSREKNR